MKKANKLKTLAIAALVAGAIAGLATVGPELLARGNGGGGPIGGGGGGGAAAGPAGGGTPTAPGTATGPQRNNNNNTGGQTGGGATQQQTQNATNALNNMAGTLARGAVNQANSGSGSPGK